MNMDNIASLLQVTVNNLETQFMQSQDTSAAPAHRSFSAYSLGYIFGFTCGGFDYFRIENNYQQMGMLTRVYNRLFEQAGPNLFKNSLILQDNPDFKKGSLCGWEEMKRFLFRQETPIGLTRFLKYGEMSRTFQAQDIDKLEPAHSVSEAAMAH